MLLLNTLGNWVDRAIIFHAIDCGGSGSLLLLNIYSHIRGLTTTKKLGYLHIQNYLFRLCGNVKKIENNL